MLKEISKRGLSQQQISAKIGMSQSSVSRMIRGVTDCNFKQGEKIRQLYESYMPAEKWTEQKAKDKIESLKRALVVQQGNFEEAQVCIQRLEKTINAMKGRRCWLCRVKLFFKGQ
jgi:predicted transcriptional regulator